MANSALIDDLLKQFSENPRRVFARLANEYRKRGELESAIEICRHHVPLQPTYISGHIVLGQALYESGQLDEARASFETALGLDPENLIALRQLGDIACAHGDDESASAWYRRLLEVDPQNEDAAAQLRELEREAVAPEPAEAYEPLAAHDVSWGDINPERAAEALVTSPPEEALAPEPALERGAHDPEEGAIAELPSVAELAPVEDAAPPAFATETMAELYLSQGFTERALAVYRQLGAQRPNDSALRDRIAELEGDEGESPDALVEVIMAGRTAREFFGAFAHRRPPSRQVAPVAEQRPDTPSVLEDDSHQTSMSAAALDGLFAGHPVSAADDDAAAMLAEAFSESRGLGESGATGEPARAAGDELSLDDVFGNGSQKEGVGRAGASMSFDQFFARDEGGSHSIDRAHSGAHQAESGEGNDLEVFHAWLEGLKK